MVGMSGIHNAENTKLAIEEIINSYEFEKKNIKSVVCDEGKNLIRLFKQPQFTDLNLTSRHPGER